MKEGKSVLNVFVRGVVIPEQSISIISAFGIREDHVAVRYVDILQDNQLDKLIDCFAIFKVIKLLNNNHFIDEPIIVWSTDKSLVSCINGKRKPKNKRMLGMVESIQCLTREMGNIEIQWIEFDKNLASLMINQAMLKKKTEYFFREKTENMDKEQLINRILELEKENLELQKDKQNFGIELAKRQVLLDTLKCELQHTHQELDEYKAAMDQIAQEQMVAYMLSTPPLSPYLH